VRLDVFDTEKKKVGQVDLDDSVFAAPVKDHLFWEVVRMQLTNKRRGTQSTKTITNLSGTGKKPFRQKGTGRARQGSLRSGQMRGGAVVHGPLPRDYSYEMPKKMVKSALRSALSLRAKETHLFVIKGWSPKAAKTKDAKAVLDRFDAKKALVVDSRDNEKLMLSVRNLPHAKFLPVEALNVRDILHYDHLFVSEAAVQKIAERLRARASRKELGAAPARTSREAKS
jgi:large subunit ribosomal protein L4